MDFNTMADDSRRYKSERERRYKDSSKERLTNIAKRKIQTTMIGALSSIEKHFGFFWAHDEQRGLTPEEQSMHELFEEVRSEILDRGNNQIRNLESELSHYDISWLRYNLTLPVKSE